MLTIPFFYWAHGDNVTQYFYKMIGSAFSRKGYNVIPMCVSDPGFSESCIRLGLAEKISFGFSLTPAALELHVGDVPIWKYLNIPFFVYFLDTPVYDLRLQVTKDLLLSKESRIVFGFPDANQRKIIFNATRKNNLNLRTLFVPFAAPVQSERVEKWNDRPMDVVVFGNVGKEISASGVAGSIQQTLAKYIGSDIPVDLWVDVIHSIINSQSSKSVTEELLQAAGAPFDKIFEEPWRSAISDADSFVKRYRRIQIVGKLLGRTIHTFGSGWDAFENLIPNLVNHGSKKYEDQFKIFSQSKFSINIDPNWDFGVHDRIFNAATMGAISLTQRNEYVEAFFPDGEACLCYHQNGDEISDAFLRSDAEMHSISYEGRRRALSFHTWDNRVHDIIEVMNSGGN